MSRTLLVCLSVSCLLVLPAAARADDPAKAIILERLQALEMSFSTAPGGNVVGISFGCHSDVRDGDLILLKAFPKLERLTVIGADDITDTGVEKLKGLKLKKLAVFSDKLTDKSMRHLATMTDLEELDLRGATMTAAGLAELKKLPNLRTLLLRESGLTDADVAQFAGFPKLATLRIGSHKVTEAGLQTVKSALPKAIVSR